MSSLSVDREKLGGFMNRATTTRDNDNDNDDIIRTTTQHDEPRSTPVMWTPNVLPVRGNYKSRPNSASPIADCQGHYRVSPEHAREYAFLSTRVLPRHPPLPGVAGTHTSRLAAMPELQTLRILPLYHTATRIQEVERTGT